MSQDKYAAIRREAARARQMMPKPRDIAVGLMNPVALVPFSRDRVEQVAIASAVTLFLTLVGLAFLWPNILTGILGVNPTLLNWLMPPVGVK